MRRLFLPLAIVAAAFLFWHGTHAPSRKTFFSVSAIQSNHSFDSRLESHPLSDDEKKEIQQALQQPYRYFGCGGQAFAFFSADGKYVLKFFKQNRFTPPLYSRFTPIVRTLKEKSREERRFREYFSYKASFDLLQEYTGVIYVHLNKTTSLRTSVTIIDASQNEYFLDLDTVDFVLQRRGSLFTEAIQTKMAHKDLAGAQKLILSAFDLLATCSQKGFYDRDPNVLTNFGVCEDRVIKLDLGSWSYLPSKKKEPFFQHKIDKYTGKLYDWIQEKYPDLVPCIEEQMKRDLLHEKS